MINTEYLVDESYHDSGGYCDFYPIKNHPDLGFKSFKNKIKAQDALSNQKLLAQFDLAPEPITDLCKIRYDFNPKILSFLDRSSTITGWGFVTEKAGLIDYENCKTPYLPKIQKLVDDIWSKTRMKFWDCHEYNIGYIKRGRKKQFVCIDTGKESFEPHSNAWGYSEPGPKCCYCNKYQCRCEE